MAIFTKWPLTVSPDRCAFSDRRESSNTQSLTVLAAFFSPLAMLFPVMVVPSLAAAEVVTDGTVGLQTNLQGPVYHIDAALGAMRGGNLFHSFSQFDLVQGETANFSGPNTVQNIVSRVTGQASYIDGTLASSIANANLYFINPKGVVFGPNASLQLPASFYVSTGHSLTFGDGGVFYADPQRASVLTAAAPAGFGFLGTDSGSATVLGANLAVPSGHVLSVVAEDVLVAGGATLASPDGHLQVAAVGEGFAGEVPLSAASLATTGLTGVVALSGGSQLMAEEVLGGGAPAVFIRGGQLVLEDSSSIEVANIATEGAELDVAMAESIILSGGSGIYAYTFGAAEGPTMSVVTPGTMHFSGYAEGDGTGLATVASSTGRGGDVFLSAGNLELLDSGLILSYALGTGAGGDLYLSVAETLTAHTPNTQTDLASGIHSTSTGNTDAGDIGITAGTLDLDLARATSVVPITRPFTEAGGKSGDISIVADDVLVKNGAAISSYTQGVSAGLSGDVSIVASGRVEVSGPSMTAPSEISSANLGDGDSGLLFISADTLVLSDDAQIGSQPLAGTPGGVYLEAENMLVENGAQVVSITAGQEDGSQVVISVAEQMVLDQGYIRTTTVGGGAAGDIYIFASDVLLTNAAALESASYDNGEAQAQLGNSGLVSLAADRLRIDSGAFINATSSGSMGGDAGDVYLNLSDSLEIYGYEDGSGRSGIAAATEEGNAGEGISIYASEVVMNNGGIISTRSVGSGAAGDITVVSQVMTLQGGSLIEASTNAENGGLGGDVYVRASNGLFISDLGTDGSPSQISALTNGGGDGGSVVVDGGEIVLAEEGRIMARSLGAGNAGDIHLRADSLDIGPAAGVDALASGMGNGGTIAVDLRGDLRIEGYGPISVPVADIVLVLYLDGINANTFNAGNAGNIDITANAVHLSNHGNISSSSGPTLNLAVGEAGGVHVAADNITVDSGGRIMAESWNVNGGAPGSVTLDVAENLVVDGVLDGNASAVAITNNSNFAGGQILVEADRVVVRDDAVIEASTIGNGDGGAITLLADSILVSNAQVRSASAWTGQGGNVGMRGREIEITDQAGIFSVALASGDAGEVYLEGGDRILVSNGAQVATSTVAAGNAGRIVLVAPHVRLEEGSFVDSSTANLEGGEISGMGGEVFVEAGTLEVLSGTNISATSLESSAGEGGNIFIDISDTFYIEGGETRGGVVTSTFGQGDGGNITITGGSLVMKEGASIEASSDGEGKGGGIVIALDESLSMQEQSLINSSSFSSGRGGEVLVSAAGDIRLQEQSNILALSQGLGNAGNITLAAGQGFFLSSESVIGTLAEYADGGEIGVTAGGVFLMHDGALSAQVQGGEGSGGNVDIVADAVALNDGRILASAIGGNGGNINIVSAGFQQTPGTEVNASSEKAISGIIDITAPWIDLNSGIAVLPSNFLQEKTLFRDLCQRRAGKGSVLVYETAVSPDGVYGAF